MTRAIDAPTSWKEENVKMAIFITMATTVRGHVDCVVSARDFVYDEYEETRKRGGGTGCGKWDNRFIYLL